MNHAQRADSIEDEQVDDRPTMPAPMMKRQDRTLVLGCLLAVSCTAALIAAQWTTPHVSASEPKPQVRARSYEAAAIADSLILEVDAPAEHAAPPVDRSDDAPAQQEAGLQSETEPTIAVRQSAALVRDANRLLRLEPALARALFAVAATTDPRNPHAHAGLARALHRLNKPVEARAAIEQALRIRPKRASYRAFLATLVAESGESTRSHR